MVDGAKLLAECEAIVAQEIVSEEATAVTVGPASGKCDCRRLALGTAKRVVYFDLDPRACEALARILSPRRPVATPSTN